ncbi:MAG: hypothetical protein HWN68_14535 [Desulfobacterales bacterium]|nr:hypothetical protein [Desulfobacterales bacterium]
MNGALYQVEEIDLGSERLEDADGDIGPREIFSEFDCVTVLHLDGEAQISFSLEGREDFFDLVQGMRVYMPKEGRKRVLVINQSQPTKKLILFLGYQGRSEIWR